MYLPNIHWGERENRPQSSSQGSLDKSHFRHDHPHLDHPRHEIREKKAEGQRQGSKGYSGSSCWTPSPSSCHSSCLYLSSQAATPLSHSTRPLPTFQAVTSPEIITRSGKRRKVWEPSELNSILAGQRETFPLQGSRSRRSLNQTYRDTGRTYRDSRKYTGKRTKILAGLPVLPCLPCPRLRRSRSL